MPGESQNFSSKLITYLKIIVSIELVLLIVYTFKFPFPIKILAPQFYFSLNYSSLNNPIRSAYNKDEDKYDDVHHKLINFDNFTFITNPHVCDTNRELLLLIMILSKPDNYNYRKQIRRTWGRTDKSTKVVFLLGQTDDDNLSQLVQDENVRYNDIVQGNIIDAYKNLTYKHVMGFKWVARYCPKALYILKSDDDVVINTRELRRYLIKELLPAGTKEMILCNVMLRSPVLREGSQEDLVVPEIIYSGNYYPRYCSGYSILYTQDTVRKLLSTVQTLPYFWIEDVHITGTAANLAKIPRIHREKNFKVGPLNLDFQEIPMYWKSCLTKDYKTVNTDVCNCDASDDFDCIKNFYTTSSSS